MDFDESFDFIIVGSGAGAVATALWLKSIGKHAVILEKTDRFGGSTAMSGGILWAPNNMIMRRHGIADSEERALTYFDAVVGDVGPSHRQSAARPSSRPSTRHSASLRLKACASSGRKAMPTITTIAQEESRAAGH